ncbi:collagen alpha-1(I) chain-like [Enhydra lutris kenyoni]|uniref:Collagen alpha-1(I) chain-like n=1 Tax=Enhydra lutris kenyoni TaxID=391180 RepID=A0A2Y9KW69_ENHLU|nr:collagen alpha-1(I) chain-like [Enhydra lutris kenyoni]
MGSQLENAPLHPDVNVRGAPASRQESGSVYTSVFPVPPNQKSTHSDKTLIFKLCERGREASGPAAPFAPTPAPSSPPGATNPTKPDQKPTGRIKLRRAGAGRGGRARPRTRGLAGGRAGQLGRRSGGAAGSAALPGRREGGAAPLPGRRRRPKAGLSSPPSPTGPPPPAQIQPNASRAPASGPPSAGPEPREALAAPGARARVGPQRRRSRKGTESSSLVQKWRRAEPLPLRTRGRGRGARAGRRHTGDAGDAGAPGPGRSSTRPPGVGRGESAPSPTPPQPPLAEVFPPGAPPPRWGGGPGRKARGAARASPPERRAPGPPLPSAPAGREPRNSRPANFKGPPAHQSARAAGPRRPRHSPLIRGRAPLRDLAGAPGRAPAPAPGSARSGSPGPPRAGPGVGEHRESHGRGGGCGETTIPGLERAPPGRRVKRRAPPPLLCKRPEWASAPAAAAPGPSGPRPARLSTQVLFPAVTPRTKCPPGASNKNCAVDLTVHFKGASRAHGPEREVRAGRAPGRPPVPQPPLPGAGRLTPPLGPGLGLAGPPPTPGARDSARRDLAPCPRGAFFEAAPLGPRLHPHLLQQGFRRGRRALRTPGGPEVHCSAGLFLFPCSRVVTELPGPYQSAAGSSRLPRAGLGEPVIPPRQSQPRSAGPRRPP